MHRDILFLFLLGVSASNLVYEKRLVFNDGLRIKYLNTETYIDDIIKQNFSYLLKLGLNWAFLFSIIIGIIPIHLLFLSADLFGSLSIKSKKHRFLFEILSGVYNVLIFLICHYLSQTISFFVGLKISFNFVFDIGIVVICIQLIILFFYNKICRIFKKYKNSETKKKVNVLEKKTSVIFNKNFSFDIRVCIIYILLSLLANSHNIAMDPFFASISINFDFGLIIYCLVKLLAIGTIISISFFSTGISSLIGTGLIFISSCFESNFFLAFLIGVVVYYIDKKIIIILYKLSISRKGFFNICSQLRNILNKYLVILTCTSFSVYIFKTTNVYTGLFALLLNIAIYFKCSNKILNLFLANFILFILHYFSF